MYYITGLSSHLRGHDEEAIRAFQKCLSIDENYSDAYAAVCASCIRTGNNRLAVKYAETGIAKDGTDYRLYVNEADALKNLGEYGLAIDFYEKGATLEAPDAVTLFKTGVCCKHAKRTEKSIDCFLEVLEMNSGYYDAYFELGDAYFRLDEYGKAKEYLDELTALKPDYENITAVDRLLDEIKKKGSS
jgi:tetratricopeptide (TPR) repeat protein